MTTNGRARELAIVTAVTAALAAVHNLTPAGPHSWHWVHLVAQLLYYVPILMTAAWLGVRPTLALAAIVSVLSVAHVLRDWAGQPLVQAEELAQIGGFWIIGSIAGILFDREKHAREQVRQSHEETLGALASSLELRERYTAGHSQRVRDYVLLLADELGLTDPDFRASLAEGALLHDVGKIGIPDHILLKPSPLEAAEEAVMRHHPDLGAALVGDIPWLRPARELIQAHHERFDGGGYPRGLAGEAIPLVARVFAVADTFDALTTDRPYHSALSWQEGAQTIVQGRGTQFDPAVVEAFRRLPFESLARVAAATGVHLRSEPSFSDASPPLEAEAQPT